MESKKERLLKSLDNIKTDRPPCICPGGMMNMITKDLMEKIGTYLPEAHKNRHDMVKLIEAVVEESCFENYGVLCMTLEAEAYGSDVDYGSDIFEPHVVGFLIDEIEDFKNLKEMDFSNRVEEVLSAIEILKSEGNKDIPIIGNVTGPISLATTILDPVKFYKALVKKNKLAHEYLDFLTADLVKLANKMADRGADLIAIADPSGTGEILGPKRFEEFTVYYINKIVDSLAKRNIKTIVHICGNMTGVYKEVNKIRSNTLSFDSMVSMTEAKKNLKDRVLMGNVSTYALEFMESSKIKDLTLSAKRNGSSIISPACGLGMKTPIENIKAMLEALEEENA